MLVHCMFKMLDEKSFMLRVTAEILTNIVHYRDIFTFYRNQNQRSHLEKKEKSRVNRKRVHRNQSLILL